MFGPGAYLFLMFGFLAGVPSADASPADPPRSAKAVRATQPPSIDGRSDDVAWRTAPVLSDFTQFSPSIGAPPAFRTEFQAAYDDHNLYVHVRAYDPHPDSIMHALTRRDSRGPSDQIRVFISSYNDGRSGYEFSVNPDGVKRDLSLFNDTQASNSWNGVWDVATLVDSLGWTAEFRIPLTQLRYAASASHTFGFAVWREIERLKQSVSWPEYQPTRTGMVSQFGTLDGLEGITTAHPLELTPYTVTKNVSRAGATSGWERVQQVTAGADLKYGVTQNVTLDATVNPDFGQVEADPAVLNLSAFETFLSERRPFFVEGTGLYRFPLNCYIVVDCSTNEGLFYSRRIGRTPTLLGDYGDRTTPAVTPIAAAGKITGRTQRGLSFGILDALTPRVMGSSSRTVEPLTNFAVLRAQQDLRGGQAGVDWILTAVNRSLDEWSSPVLHRSAYVTGMNFRSRMFGGQYELAGSITGSRVAGSADAITRTQRSAVHYYQQPDDEPEFDLERTSLSGHAEQVKFGKYGGGVTRFETSLVRMSSGFEPNDLGYLRRADLQDWSTWASVNFRTPRWIYNWWSVNANHWQTWNTSGRRLEDAVNINTHVGFKNNWNAHLGGTLGRLGTTWCDRCTRGGPALRRSRVFSPWFGLNGDDRRRLVPGIWTNFSVTDEGLSHNVSLQPRVSLRLSTGLRGELGAEYSRSDDRSQWYGNFTAGSATHYTFARLQQHTVGASVRINYTASPDLTFEFYGEPFVSTGTYSNFRELSPTPGASAYADRFQPYSPPAAPPAFRYRQLRTNSVLRWEYRPGSTLFLVWAHGREAYTRDAQERHWSDVSRDLLELHPDNTFLVKVAYWLSR